MRLSLLSLSLILFLIMGPLVRSQSAEIPSINFATVAEGRKLLTMRDDFVVRLSAFDRAARMKTDKEVSEQDYLEFVSRNVLAWIPGQRSLVEAAWVELSPTLAKFKLPFPKTIHFVKTTGEEEGNQEYTRSDEIILPDSAFDKAKLGSLKGTIAHELFHILSRNPPGFRERLYSVIGFQSCGEVSFPAALATRKLTDLGCPKE